MYILLSTGTSAYVFGGNLPQNGAAGVRMMRLLAGLLPSVNSCLQPKNTPSGSSLLFLAHLVIFEFNSIIAHTHTLTVHFPL